METINSAGEPLYYTWSDAASRTVAIEKAMSGFNERQPMGEVASTRYKNIQPNISVIDGFDRSDYEFFRPGEAIPRTRKGVIGACMQAYNCNEIVNNIVNLMSELTSQGIRLTHPVKSIERLYNQWFNNIIKGPELAEKFVNLLVRSGQPIVHMITGSIKDQQVKKLKQLYAADFTEVPKDFSLRPMEIPCKYIFLNPLSLDIVGEELAAFAGTVSFSIKIPAKVKSIINGPRTEAEREIVKTLPPTVIEAARSETGTIYLDPKRVKAYYYKKDDWDIWAYPMIAPILSDLIHFEKLKLADMAALDGIISHVRIWKLGDLDAQIIPGRRMLAEFNDMIMQHAAGGTIDIVWNPAIKLEESSTDIAKVLGMEKYIVCLANIYSGLGIPPSLTGFGKETGMTNSFISTKVLSERLRYLRNALTSFILEQATLFQKSLGIKSPPKVDYDYINLGDEAADKALWVQLIDRDIVSVESMQERFGRIPEIENMRIKREYKLREKGKMPAKAGAFHDSNPELSMKKILLTQGAVTASEVGLELEERKPGEESVLDMQKKISTEKPKGQPQQGRPANSKDTKKRKGREERPRVGTSTAIADTIFSANKAITNIRTQLFANYAYQTDQKLDDISGENMIALERAAFAALFSIDDIRAFTFEDVTAEYAEEADAIFNRLILPLFQTEEYPTDDIIAENVSMVYSIMNTELKGD